MNSSKIFVTIIGAAASAFFVLGCNSFQAESFWGPAHNLSGVGTTYAWRQGAKCEPDSGKAQVPDVESTIQELIDADFSAKGYRRAGGEKPDVNICYRLGKVVAQAETGLASWDDAVIELDVTEPAKGGLVWRGRVRGRIDYAAAPDVRKGRLESAVQQLMKPLPKASSR